ncbi:MerR family transcriptional regulator [Flavobacterium sandaracinum]|uniref:MerR family transcriptional regulator n=2 Tax=Flavobacterium sandaracinum TaxID=2541733 RepID=A0A4R5D3E2_9FLAO|nr:MerR family transcriptional regulator [Flavobacterium sandaracinum]
MKMENLIPIPELCILYTVELSFFTNLSEMGLLEIKTIESKEYIDSDAIYEIEKIIRIHKELDVNIAGIDVVLNLLQKIDGLHNELNTLRNRLRLYES